MRKKTPQEILQHFQNGSRVLPDFKHEREKKIFLKLQKYNLLHVNAEGILTITKKGEEALKGDVEKHISIGKFEKRLIKYYFKENRKQKILLCVIIPIIILLAIYLIAFHLL